MENKFAVIYCRVSSKKQVHDGNGLDSQEHKCRIWCKNNGYTVLNVFKDEGISGGIKDRPALQEMIEYLQDLKEKCIVLVEDLNRWSRSVENHFHFRDVIMKLGHRLQSVNMTLDDSEESEMMETISAGVSQYERKKNAKRAKSCMIDNAKQGFWLMNPPTGYIRKKINKRVNCIRLEPTATYIQEALEGFANGRFLTKKDIVDYLKNKEIHNCWDNPIVISFNLVKKMLENKIYTGIFAYEKWNIPEQKWAIEPIITTEVYEKIQNRLHGKGNPIEQRKYSIEDAEFPLRRWVKCAYCGEPLTASKSRSKSGKYHPYYHCRNKNCCMRGKGIKEKDIHYEFEHLLEEITPNNQLIELTKALIKDKYNDENKIWLESQKQLKNTLKQKEDEKEKCFNLLLNSSGNDNISKMCSERMDKLDIEISECKDKLSNRNRDENIKLEEFSEYSLNFMKNPVGIWRIGDYKQKRGVLNLCFTEPILYDREKKFGTPKLSPIFAVFNDFCGNKREWCAIEESNL